MNLRVHHKLFLSYAILVVGVLATLVAGIDAGLRTPLLQQTADELERELALAREIHAARPAGAPVDSIVRHLGALTGHRVSLIGPDGRLLADSRLTPAAVASAGPYTERPEIQAAIRSGVGRSVRASDSVGEELVYVASVTADGSILRIAVEIGAIESTLAGLRVRILQVGAFALLLAALLSFGFSVFVTRPLRRLRDVAASMGSESLVARLRGSRRDEIGELEAALDGLAEELGSRLAQLDGERAEMTALVDSMAEGVLAIAPDGTLRRANPAARTMFGLGPEVGGLAPEAIARRRPFLDLVQQVLAGDPIAPTEITHDDRHLLATARPLPRGGAVVVLLDTSELRRLEGIRRDFVANASHELKTPLTVIRGHAETLLDPDLPDELRESFGRSLRTNVERLQAILDDLLDLSRIESGGWKPQPRRLSITAVARDAWEPLETAARERGVAFVLDVEDGCERIEADPGALRQIFANLFSNALRYTPEGGQITVAVHRAAEGRVRIEVRDTGSGIPAPHLGRIFERFYRVDPARSRIEGGTGLGLAIVRHLVERHGGRVEAESEVGRGTTIRFFLPMRARPGLGSGPSEAEADPEPAPPTDVSRVPDPMGPEPPSDG